MRVRFTSDSLDRLEVLHEGELDCMPRIGEFVLTKTLAVLQVVGVVHVMQDDGALLFAMTRLVRPAPE